jgi:hypothetical protein
LDEKSPELNFVELEKTGNAARKNKQILLVFMRFMGE